MATVSNKHPLWTSRKPEWDEVRASIRGATAVKEAGELYLPMPSGFRAQEDRGLAMYLAYITRAQFPEIFAPTVRGILGIIHRNEAQIDLPPELEYIWEKSTADGLSLETFHRQITFELLQTGRYGILVEAPPRDAGGGDPYFAGYTTESIINWSVNGDFFVLDESGLTRDGFDWKHRDQFRVLELSRDGYQQRLYTAANAVETDGRVIPVLGDRNRTLDRIPFVVVGSMNLTPTPDDPPLLGVARAALAGYRLDADYRHQLFWSGQETLVVVNGTAPDVIGAGVVIELQGDGDSQPNVFYVGPEGRGIEAHRKAIEDERENAISAGARLFDLGKTPGESGEARRLRYAGQTATLTSIAQASAAGLEQALRHIGRMKGLPPATVNKIIVKPDLKHLRGPMSADDAEALVRSWQSHGISYQTLYEQLQHGEIASPERTWEEEFNLIMDEAARIRELDPDEAGMTTGRTPGNSGNAA